MLSSYLFALPMPKVLTSPFHLDAPFTQQIAELGAGKQSKNKTAFLLRDGRL